jgi:hypothetical protein
MRHKLKTFFIYKLSGYPADSVRLVLNSYQRILKITNEFFLPAGQLAIGFLTHGITTFLKSLEGRRGIVSTIALVVYKSPSALRQSSELYPVPP